MGIYPKLNDIRKGLVNLCLTQAKENTAQTARGRKVNWAMFPYLNTIAVSGDWQHLILRVLEHRMGVGKVLQLQLQS